MESKHFEPEIRRDPVSNRWVIFSRARAKRPTDFKSKEPQNNPPSTADCPFCIGNEHLCAPEIFRAPNSPDWKLRVIQNLFPALNRAIDNSLLESENENVVNGFGFHDVVIEAPLHASQLVDMEADEIGEILLAYKTRITQIIAHKAIKYIQVFKNHGASAGASLSHSHSQIISLPIVPPNVCSRLEATKQHFAKTGKCAICDGTKDDHLVVASSKHFVAMVPFAGTYAFEFWIIPRNHSPHFHDLSSEEAMDLGGMMKCMLGKMNSQLNYPPYNFMIQTSPLKIKDSEVEYSHWFLQVVPQLTNMAGFEMGTGCFINPVFPEDAAIILKNAR